MTRDSNTTDRRILEVLETGRATPGFLADGLDLEQSHVSQRLTQLVDDDHVQRLNSELYDLTAGERIHLSADLATEISERKGPTTSYEEYIKQLLRVDQEFPEVSERDKTPDTVHTDDPAPSEQAEPGPETDTGDSPDSENSGE
jgi:hypothetical protein